MIAVGTVNPVLPAPRFVQGTASPVGTVMSTQLRFSIQGIHFFLTTIDYSLLSLATQPLRRTTLNQTYISIYRVGVGLVRQIDCKYSTDVYIFNTTLIFFVPNPPWVLGATYYITLTDGVATADYYCGPEATGFSSKIFDEQIPINVRCSFLLRFNCLAIHNLESLFIIYNNDAIDNDTHTNCGYCYNKSMYQLLPKSK